MKKIAWLMLLCSVVLIIPAMAFGETVVTHLTYISHGQNYNDWIMKQAEAFNKANPGIRVEVIIGNQEKMKTMMAAGVAPDVLDMPDFDYLGREGGLVDIRPFLVRDNLWNSFNPALLNLLIKQNGAIYNVPFELGVVAVYFNRDMFNEAGLNTPDRMGANWTWDAMVAAGKKLTHDADGNGIPEKFGIDRPWGYWRTAIYQAGGTFYEFDEDELPVRSLWNTPEVLRGVEYTLSFYREGITPHKYHLAGALNQVDYYFWTGKTAIDVTDGLGIIDTYLSQSDFNWDFALQPAGPAGPVAGSAGMTGPLILSSSKCINEAWEWVKFYAMDKERMEDWIRSVGRIPALANAQAAYATIKGLTQKNFRAIIEQANYPPKPQYPVDNFLAPRLISLDPVWKEQKSPAIFLQEVHEKMTGYIAELRASKGAAK
ncbi:MAG TPA: extracellular solute-binding protein [Firmicutes bacterium]|nr:extracellular solute-binding protein [Bacillota bacterium]